MSEHPTFEITTHVERIANLSDLALFSRQWENPITLYIYPIPSRTCPSRVKGWKGEKNNYFIPCSCISDFVTVGFYYNLQTWLSNHCRDRQGSRDPSRTTPFSMLHCVRSTPYNGPPLHSPHVSISPCPCCMMYRRCFYFHLEDCRSYHPRPPLDATAPRICSSSAMIVGIIISCRGQWGDMAVLGLPLLGNFVPVGTVSSMLYR